MSDFVISFRVLLPSDEMQFISLPLRVAALTTSTNLANLEVKTIDAN